MSANGRSILLINDDRTQLRLAERILQREGYRVHAADSAQGGLRTLRRREDIAAIVTDLHMPDIDGWRLCRLLRSPAFGDYHRLPILVLSATFSGDDAEHITRELGANGFLPAPFQPEDLVGRVEDMLAGRTSPTPMDVLLVQRRGPQCDLLAEAFRVQGFVVETARSIETGQTLYRRRRHGTVIVGHDLPGGDVLQLLEEIKRPGSRSVAIVTTDEHDPALALELVRAGADGYVREIYDPDYVVTLCDRARRQRSLLRVEELLERRTTELREARERLDRVFAALPMMILVCEPGGRILCANPAADELLGGGPGTLPGRSVTEFACGAPEDAWAARLDEPHGTTALPAREAKLRLADGRLIPVEVLQAPLTYAGQPAWLVAARDRSERQRIEEERALLASALEQADEIFYLTGPDGSIEYVNPAFERATGYERDEVVGQPLTLLRGEPDDPAWKEMLAAVSGNRRWKGRLARSGRGGREFLTDGSLSPVMDARGRTVNWIGVERDVSQNVELERALIQAQKMEAVGTLAGGLAHDFNNLLTGILGYANLIRRLAPEKSEIPEMAGIIESSAERASQLTRQLLGFARRGKHRHVPMDLNQVVERVVQLLSRTIDKQIRIRKQLRESPTVAVGDPSQMEQVLLNLAINACDAMQDRDGAELVFTTGTFDMDEAYCAGHPGAHPGRTVSVAVTDNGCGIPRELQQRVFEPFFTTKKKGKGTGMGLSMVYGIVKNHGGTIRTYSELGKGSTFRIYLPRATSQEPAPPAESGTGEVIRGEGRVLVVDDEEVVRHTASSMLRNLGYDVISFADAEEAVLYYRHFGDTVDVVLIDMVMPGMDGRACFRALRELDRKVKAVLSTGFGLNDEAQSILDEGVLGFAEKPYRIADLSHVVDAARRGERSVAGGES